jgi:uncharacterized membrane protein
MHMKIGRKQTVNLVLVLAAFVLAAVLYGKLPDRMPTHWNWKGEVDGYMGKPAGAFGLPAVMTGLWLLFLVLPRISPKEFSMDPFIRIYDSIAIAVIGFMFYINALVLLAGLGVAVPMTPAVLAGVGVLFIIIGAGLGKTTKNFFVGIRTPWTLANDVVWKKTHKLGGKLFVIAGVITVASGFFRCGIWILLVAIALAALVPVVYSYILYRKIV